MLAEQYLEPSIIFFRLNWIPTSKWTKVRFDGAVLSALDIKRCIMNHEKLTDDPDIYDLALTNMQTGEEFREEGFLVPRNSALVARKIPCTKAASDRIRGPPLTMDSSNTVENIYGGGTIIGKPNVESDAAVANFLSKGDDYAELADCQLDYVPGIPNPREEASRGGFGFSGSRLAYRFDPQAKPPPGYVCHRCEQPGHFIRFCPTNDDPNYNFRRIKPATGIPVSFMKPISEPKPLNPLETPCDDKITTVRLSDESHASALPNQRQFARSLAETGTEHPAENSAPEVKAVPLRKELFCRLCEEPFLNAVMTICCFVSFCDACIRLRLISEDGGVCPSCGAECRKEDLRPNENFQSAVDDYVEKFPEKANSRISKYVYSKEKIINKNPQLNPELANPFSSGEFLLLKNAPLSVMNSRIVCYSCRDRGHIAANCPKKRTRESRYGESKSNFSKRRQRHGRESKREKPRYERKQKI